MAYKIRHYQKRTRYVFTRDDVKAIAMFALLFIAGVIVGTLEYNVIN